VEYFVGKKLPFGYFPSFCVKGHLRALPVVEKEKFPTE
jgi:hypothetical protein